MGLNDIVLTPFLLILFSMGAYWLRPRFVNNQTKKYFLPALFFKFFAAIFIGLLYQFYYNGGDTYYYFGHAGILREAFLHDFSTGISLLFRTDNAQTTAFAYYSRMFWYSDSATYFVCQVAGFFDLITFHTYSSTALFFAIFSFSGSWRFFSVMNRLYLGNTKGLGFIILFIPSVVVWGSGLLKDSLTLGATFWLVAILLDWNKYHRLSWFRFLWLLVTFYVVYKVKIYILMALLPALIFWIVFSVLNRIKHPAIKIIITPFLCLVVAVGGYFSASSLVSENSKYSLDNLAETTRITSYDIGFYTGGGSGSSYALGELDGTFTTMLSLAPISIVTSLFRPFLWEVRNPLMLLASLEGLLILFITIHAIFARRIFRNLTDPFLVSCVIFSLIFAFSVGFTFNFGTLMRYRIPMLAFYLIPLFIDKKNESSQNSH